MIETKDDCKAVVNKIDKYEIHLKGDNTYYSAKTQEEADKIAKRIESEALAELEKRNSAETKRLEHLELLSQSVCNYVKMLSKELWSLQHTKLVGRSDETTKALIEHLKEEIKNLKGFSEDKLACYWHNGYLRNSDYYSIEEVKP